MDIIFDWSGTLCDNFSQFCEVCALVFKELGREPIGRDEIRRHFTIPYMTFWNRYFPSLSEEEEKRIYGKHMNTLPHAHLYDGVDVILRGLHGKGARLFVVSSDPVERLRGEVEAAGLAPLFTEVIGGVHHKEESIQGIIKRHGLRQDATVYVGDTAGDVGAGKRVGVKTVGISWGFADKERLAEAEPDALIDDIVALPGVLPLLAGRRSHLV